MNSIICTVGASIKANLKGLGLENEFESENYEKLVNYFLNFEKDPEEARELGAEINSTVSILKRGYLDERKNIYFLVSDTKDGERIGNILKGYFRNVKNFNFENVEVIKIKRLDDSKPDDFKLYGLRNLVKEMAKIIKKNLGSVIINATGGYKAQIAFALALGQGLKVPVYYRFERFQKVIELEPLPINLDTSLYFSVRSLFDILEEKNVVLFREVENIYKGLGKEATIFFDIEKINNEKYIAISPMGQIYLEVVRNEFYYLEKEYELLERDKEFVFITSNKEGHSLELINKYRIKELFERFKYGTKARVSVYSKNEKAKNFKVKIKGDNLVVILTTKKGLIHLELETTARNEMELEIIKIKLEKYLEENFK
ncbi:putative CRISPR-associated protein [Thermosipho globiformans]|uniref:putative CRISPR-associated protein n=1 Tax=Thermosipho globiformans TaxID=380685 RepID=UPI000F8E009C|nr:putative CRISPR-associated protein [Thermosipho globiformans]